MSITTLHIILEGLYYYAFFPFPMDTLTMQDVPVGQVQLSRESLVVGEGGVVGEVGGGGSQV